MHAGDGVVATWQAGVRAHLCGAALEAWLVVGARLDLALRRVVILGVGADALHAHTKHGPKTQSVLQTLHFAKPLHVLRYAILHPQAQRSQANRGTYLEGLGHAIDSVLPGLLAAALVAPGHIAA